MAELPRKVNSREIKLREGTNMLVLHSEIQLGIKSNENCIYYIYIYIYIYIHINIS